MGDPRTGGSSLARVTLLGMGIGGGLFVAMGLYLNAATDSHPLSNLGPIAVFAVIGATVGGLVAPLFRKSDGSNASDEQPTGSEEAGDSAPSGRGGVG